jgi:hypothetical protein
MDLLRIIIDIAAIVADIALIVVILRNKLK